MQIYDNISRYIKTWMGDEELKTYLDGNMYGNKSVKYILWEFEKKHNNSFDDLNFDFYKKDVQIDHIFPEEPPFNFSCYEFNSDVDYIKTFIG